MTIWYVVEVDLTNVPPERMRTHLAGIGQIPDGAGLVIHVGPMRAEPGVCRLLAEHADRLDITVCGRNENTCRRWRELVTEPDVLVGRS